MMFPSINTVIRIYSQSCLGNFIWIANYTVEAMPLISTGDQQKAYDDNSSLDTRINMQSVITWVFNGHMH